MNYNRMVQNNYDTMAFKHAPAKFNGKGHQTVIAEAPEIPRLPQNKKNTKKWCKGVVGREHQLVWVYRDCLPNSSRHSGQVKFVEPPIPTLEEEKKLNRWVQIPWAQHICVVCHKHVKWGENSFALRRAGVKILLELPAL